jgi:hypothetical protein
LIRLARVSPRPSAPRPSNRWTICTIQWAEPGSSRGPGRADPRERPGPPSPTADPHGAPAPPGPRAAGRSAARAGCAARRNPAHCPSRRVTPARSARSPLLPISACTMVAVRFIAPPPSQLRPAGVLILRVATTPIA